MSFASITTLWLLACCCLAAALAVLPFVMRRLCGRSEKPAENQTPSGEENESSIEQLEQSSQAIPSPVAHLDISRDKCPPYRSATADDTWQLPPNAIYRALILIVEDNKVIQLVTHSYIEQLGHRADLVSNGEEAIAAMANIQYDLVLMDLAMPVLDGYEAAQHIRKHEEQTGRHVPIVAFTAHTHDGDRERCLECGMDDYVTKPISKDQLAGVLARWLPRTPAKNQPGSSTPSPQNKPENHHFFL